MGRTTRRLVVGRLAAGLSSSYIMSAWLTYRGTSVVIVLISWSSVTCIIAYMCSCINTNMYTPTQGLPAGGMAEEGSTLRTRIERGRTGDGGARSRVIV